MKLEVKKLYFKKNDKSDKAYMYLSSFAELMSKLSKAVIFIFFTPILVVSSFFTKELFTSIPNNLLSIVQISGLVYSVKIEESEFDDLYIAIIGITLLSAMMFYLTGGIIVHSSFFHEVIFSVNIFSVAVNTYFLIKEVVSGPIKILANLLFDGLNKITNFDISKFKELKTEFDYNLEDHEITLREILHNSFGYTKLDTERLKYKSKHGSHEQRAKINTDIDKINSILRLLKNRLKKYYSHPLGLFLYSDKIKAIQKAMDEVIADNKLTRAIAILNLKVTKIDIRLEEVEIVQDVLTDPSHPKFDKTLCMAFTILSKTESEGKEDIIEAARCELNDYKSALTTSSREIISAIPAKALR